MDCSFFFFFFFFFNSKNDSSPEQPGKTRMFGESTQARNKKLYFINYCSIIIILLCKLEEYEL